MIGNVESLWRYPVKSMRGQELDTAYVGFAGVYGDRLYAFRSSVAPEGFPYLTGREQERILLYQPRFRHADRAAKPVNLAAAENIAPGITPLYADAADLAVDVETPSGKVVAIDDPVLVDLLGAGLDERLNLSTDQPTLYDRLGGVYSIATVVDDFVDRIMIDPRLNANPKVDEPITAFPLLASSTSSRKWSAGPLAGLKSTRAAP